MAAETLRKPYLCVGRTGYLHTALLMNGFRLLMDWKIGLYEEKLENKVA